MTISGRSSNVSISKKTLDDGTELLIKNPVQTHQQFVDLFDELNKLEKKTDTFVNSYDDLEAVRQRNEEKELKEECLALKKDIEETYFSTWCDLKTSINKTNDIIKKIHSVPGLIHCLPPCISESSESYKVHDHFCGFDGNGRFNIKKGFSTYMYLLIGRDPQTHEFDRIEIALEPGIRFKDKIEELAIMRELLTSFKENFEGYVDKRLEVINNVMDAANKLLNFEMNGPEHDGNGIDDPEYDDSRITLD